MNVSELYQKLAKLGGKIQDLAEKNSAGDWDKEQESQWKQLNREYDKTKRELKLKEIETDDERSHETLLPEGLTREDLLEVSREMPSRKNGEVWIDSKGKEVRVFNSNENIADSEGDNLPDGIRKSELNLGRALQYIAGVGSSDSPEARLMSGLSNSAGGVMIPTILSSMLIDKARNKMCLLKAGAKTFPMESGDVSIARVTGDPTTYNHKPGEDISLSDVTLDSLNLHAHTCAIRVRVSEELLQDSINGGSQIEKILANSLANQLDNWFLTGSGSEQPTGLQNYLDVSSASGTCDWDEIIDSQTTLRGNNHEPNAAVLSPTSMGDLNKLKIASETNHYCQKPACLDTVQMLPTEQIGDSYAIVGDFEQVIIGVRQGIQVEVSKQGDGFKQNAVDFRATARVDVGLTDSKSIHVISSFS